MNNSGICEICGSPVERLFIDSGRFKCELCVNPQIIQEVSKSSMKTALKIDNGWRSEHE